MRPREGRGDCGNDRHDPKNHQMTARQSDLAVVAYPGQHRDFEEQMSDGVKRRLDPSPASLGEDSENQGDDETQRNPQPKTARGRVGRFVKCLRHGGHQGRAWGLVESGAASMA